MSKFNHSRLRAFLFLSFLVVVLTNSVCAQTSSVQTPEGQQRNPGRGLRVIQVLPFGQGASAGLQTMDLLTKYGKFEIIDDSTYFKAREAYLKTPEAKVPLEIWRGNTRLTFNVRPGELNIETNEYNAVAYEFGSVFKQVEILQQIPAYMREVEFKDFSEKQIVEATRTKAKEIIDRAEVDGTLTATQILVARIRMILDDAPEEELKTQEVLLAEFIRNQPLEYAGVLGEEFMEEGHFRPSRVLLKHYLVSHPQNLGAQQNLGYVSLRLGYWAEAEAAADLVLSSPQKLSLCASLTAYTQKAVGAFGRGDYNTGLTFAKKAFDIEKTSYQTSLVQIAAAVIGDMDTFNDVLKKFKEASPKDYETFKLEFDACEAFALAASGQDALARAVIARWSQKDRVEGRLRSYWRNFPGGSKVVDNWLRLASN